MENSIGQRFRELRKSLNLTQSKFAESIGIKQSSISQVETGGNPDVDTVVKIGITYNIDMNWLLLGIGSMYKGINIGDRALQDEIIRLTTLTEEYQDQILMLVRDKKNLEDQIKKVGP